MSGVLSNLGNAFGVLALLAAGVAVLRTNLAKGTIDALKENNEAHVKKVELQAAQLIVLAARVAVLEDENKLLRTFASGADAVAKLAAGLTETDRTRQAEHHDILAAIHAQQAVSHQNHEEAMALIQATSHTHGDRT